MPTVITSTSFTTKFSLNTDPKVFVLTDTTNISGPSIPASGVREVFTIIAPGGNEIYNNTDYNNPDILRSSGATNLIPINLPLNGDGSVVQGVYTITQNTKINDGVNPVYYLTQTNSYTYVYEAPSVSINQVIDCISPLFTSTDATNYTVNGIIPTITRTHTVDYPYGSAGEGSPLVGSAATIQTSTFYTGTQTTQISSIVLYTFLDGLLVADTIVGTKEILVDCSFVCSINCCLTTLYNTKESYRGTNQVLFEKYSALFDEVMSIVTLCLVSIDCGQANKVSTYLTKIQQIANCTNDCSCNDGTPQLVTGIGAGGVTAVVVSGGAPVTVTSNTVGDTTTYTISLSSAFVNKVNASYNTVVAAGTGITVSSSTSGDTTTYTVTNDEIYTPQNTLQFNCLFEYSNFSAPTVSITVKDVVKEGSNMDNPAVSNVHGSIGVGNWKNLNNLFNCDGWLIDDNTTFKVFATIQQIETQDINGNTILFADQYNSPQPIDVRVWTESDGGAGFYIQFVDKSTGNPVSNYSMVYNKTVLVNFLIKQ